MTDNPVATDGGTADSSPTDADLDEHTPDEPAESTGEEPPAGLLENVEESLSDDGFDVFRGRQFISIREGGQLAPNSTVAEQYFEDIEAVMLAYNENNNTIAIIPLETYYDRPNVYKVQGQGKPQISARYFLKDNGISHERTLRYRPEWDDAIGGDAVPGGLRIDLDQDAEPAQTSASTSGGDDSSK